MAIKRSRYCIFARFTHSMPDEDNERAQKIERKKIHGKKNITTKVTKCAAHKHLSSSKIFSPVLFNCLFDFVVVCERARFDV